MESIKKIAVVGGTGKSGRYLVRQLLAQGFSIKALVRNADERENLPDIFPPENPHIEIINGDVEDGETVKSLVKGCQAVVSTLGWGQPPSGPTIFSQATSHIIYAMHAWKVQRYLLVTGLHVDTPWDKKNPNTKSATDWMYTHYPASTADRQREYEALSKSDINWTLVRLPFIEQTDETHGVKLSLEDCPGDKISATDLAHFLIAQLSDDAFVKQAPFIANV